VLKEILPEQEERIMSIAAEQWKAEGFSQGVLHGEARGEARGKAEMLLRQLRRRFHTLAPEMEARVREADGSQLDDWSERFVDAQTLADVFTDPTH